MNLEQQEDYIKQLEEEIDATKKKLEDRKDIDKYDEIEMRKLWIYVVKQVYSLKDTNKIPLLRFPEFAQRLGSEVVSLYKREFNIK
jgi:hypothetical protein